MLYNIKFCYSLEMKRNFSYLSHCYYDIFILLIVDLRKLYSQAGIENKPTVFLFSDTQVLDESFLEDINNILSSGEVPNLYKPEDFEEVSVLYIFCIREWFGLRK